MWIHGTFLLPIFNFSLMREYNENSFFPHFMEKVAAHVILNGTTGISLDMKSLEACAIWLKAFRNTC